MRDNEYDDKGRTQGSCSSGTQACADLRTTVHRHIVLAAHELREARGRALEARTAAQIGDIPSYLRRVRTYLSRANRLLEEWSSAFESSETSKIAERKRRG